MEDFIIKMGGYAILLVVIGLLRFVIGQAVKNIKRNKGAFENRKYKYQEGEIKNSQNLAYC